MKMITLSAIILTKNSGREISKCLKSLSWCDEIIVVDDNSEDKTRQMAKKLGARVFRRSLNNNFAAQRNFGLKKAKGKWVLFVDVDEIVTPALRDEIVQLTNNPIIEYSGFYIRRQDFIWGKRLNYGETGSIKLLRLAKHEAGKWKRPVHESWQVSGKKRLLKNALLHYPHPSLNEFISSINRFSTLHAMANLRERKRASLGKIICWPMLKFVLNWIIKRGFLDGMPGFIVALTMSFHSYLAWSKLWILQKRK
jgi:glycosyltransferase involved in cell wall biosynthesis